MTKENNEEIAEIIETTEERELKGSAEANENTSKAENNVPTLQLYVYKAYVTDVYDGDTITVSIDLGFNNWAVRQKIRLLGINTPEVRGPEKESGIKVRDYVRSLILEKVVVLRTIKDKKDKYGRYLGEIYYSTENEEGLTSLNVHLLEQDMADAYQN